VSQGGRHGSLAIVLHTHMPYVHGYGTWPSGEEWLWEAYASSYLPIAELMRGGAAFTLSLTPVVGDQLEAPGAAARCEEFLDVVRRKTHREDEYWLAKKPELAGELRACQHAWLEYERALEQVRGMQQAQRAEDLAAADDLADAPIDHGGHLLTPLSGHATWTSAATHAVLPLIATEAGVRLQVGSGFDSHRRRTGNWNGGLWLPECAWDPELEGVLLDEGVRSVCVEVVGGPAAGLDPWETPGGLRIAPIDRPLIDAVWHHTGYPSRPAYRDSHRRSFQNNPLWANHGGVYDPEAGAAQARADAAEWADACAAAVAGGKSRVAAFDTELFGHWWHEGPLFLAAAVEALAERGVELVQLDDLLQRTELEVAAAPPASTWGRSNDLRTWSDPAVATIAWELRRAELELLVGREPGGVPEAALRDLLVLQSSDWAFMVAEDRVPGYAWSRFAEHRRALTRPAGSLPSSRPRLRHLAPDLAQDALAVG
jgi:1,4-alpha-glucan branching enzyme